MPWLLMNNQIFGPTGRHAECGIRAHVALAETLRAELATLDAKMEKVPGLMCTVRNLRS